MGEHIQHIGILSLDIHIPEAQSLKEKRTVIRGLKDRLRNKFNVSIAELDSQDKWQRATLDIAMIGNDRRYLNRCLDNIVSFVEHCGSLVVSDYEIVFI